VSHSRQPGGRQRSHGQPPQNSYPQAQDGYPLPKADYPTPADYPPQGQGYAQQPQPGYPPQQGYPPPGGGYYQQPPPQPPGRKRRRVRNTILAAVGAAVALIVLLVIIGAVISGKKDNGGPARHTPSPAQVAIQRAVAAECKPSAHIYNEVNSSQTVGSFDQGVAVWEADLTAAQPTTRAPRGPNEANEIAVDYAEANFALSLAAQSDDPFSNNFSMATLKRGYNMALEKLQDVLNRCAVAGQ
jgi:hypothetical protein